LNEYVAVAQKGGGIVKKGLSREAIEAKLRYAKMELETAGFIHSRDLRKHIFRLEKMLRKMHYRRQAT
jgi:hypothetical protein